MTQQLAAARSAPWCIGMADASNSGWPGTDWIEDIILHQAGVQVYDKWVAGTLSWTSAPIAQAWQAFGRVATAPGLVRGGTPSELQTGFDTVGESMFKSPPQCYLDHDASAIPGLWAQDKFGLSNSGALPRPVTGYNFIPFPALKSSDGNGIEVGGDLLGMFNPTPAARAFIAYLTTPQAQEAWVSRPHSSAISVNRDVPISDYPDQVSRDIAKILTRTVNVRFDASDLMPPIMASSFNSGVLEYLDNPGQLHTILQGLDQVQKATYTG
jgi:alpha-glucoside transport system substrate-binding protein